MAKMVLLASHVTIAANDLSDRCHKIELTTDVEEKDVTTFASLGWKEVLGGIKSGSLGLGFKQDVATTELDSIMWPLLGTVVAFVVKLDNGTTTTSNPAYSGSVLIKGWNPINGSVGDTAEVDVSYPTSGAVSRATS